MTSRYSRIAAHWDRHLDDTRDDLPDSYDPDPYWIREQRELRPGVVRVTGERARR